MSEWTVENGVARYSDDDGTDYVGGETIPDAALVALIEERDDLLRLIAEAIPLTVTLAAERAKVAEAVALIDRYSRGVIPDLHQWADANRKDDR